MDGKINQTYYNLLLRLYHNDEIERLNEELWNCEERNFYIELLFQELCKCEDKERIRKYINESMIFDRKAAGFKLIVQHFETSEITEILLSDEELLIENVKAIIKEPKIDKLEIIDNANTSMLMIFIVDLLRYSEELYSEVQQILKAANKEKIKEFIKNAFSGVIVKKLLETMQNVELLEECMMDETLGITYIAKIEILKSFGESAKPIYRKCIQKQEDFEQKFIEECIKQLGDADLAIAYFNRNKGNLSETDILDLIICFKDNEQIKKCIESQELNLTSNNKAKLILYIGKKAYAEKCIENTELELDKQDITLLKMCYEIGIEEYDDKIKRVSTKLKTPQGSTKGMELESSGNIRYYGGYKKNIDYELMRAADERRWGCSKDGSGIEFTSYVMGDDEQATKSIYYICDELEKQRHEVTDIDGGHVHVGSVMLTNVQSYKNLLEMWFNLERAMFLVSNQEFELPRLPAVYDVYYAEPKSQKLNDLIRTGEIKIAQTDSIDDFVYPLKWNLGKSSSINLCNIDKKDKRTIEFRTPNGTIDPKIWIENINFFTSLVQLAEDLYQIQTKSEEEKTEDENRKIQLFKKIKSKEISEADKFESLLNIMLEEEEQRNIYRRRYNVNSELLEQEENQELKEYLEYGITDDFIGFDSTEIGEQSFKTTEYPLYQAALERLLRDREDEKNIFWYE